MRFFSLQKATFFYNPKIPAKLNFTNVVYILYILNKLLYELNNTFYFSSVNKQFYHFYQRF